MLKINLLVALLVGHVLLQFANAYSCYQDSWLTTPDSQFTAQGNGTVLHNTTNLIWKRCHEELAWNSATSSCGGVAGAGTKYTWSEALQQADDVNNSGGFAGYTDWRVPSIKELFSIIEQSCNSPPINLTIFPDLENSISNAFWSSSPSATSDANAWVLEVAYVGKSTTYTKDTSNYLRLVRGGL